MKINKRIFFFLKFSLLGLARRRIGYETMTDMAEVLSAIQQLNARIETEMGSVKEIMCSLKTEMKAEIGSMKAEISSMGAKVVVLGKQMKVLQGATIESAVRKTVKKKIRRKIQRRICYPRSKWDFEAHCSFQKLSV